MAKQIYKKNRNKNKVQITNFWINTKQLYYEIIKFIDIFILQYIYYLNRYIYIIYIKYIIINIFKI